MVALWNDDARLILIDEIKKRQEIWESRRERYASTERKKEIFSEIAEAINVMRVAPSQIFTEDDVRTQWKNLKDTFKRKVKKRQADVEAGVEDAEPTWRFWTKMLFIRQHMGGDVNGSTINGAVNSSPSFESILTSFVEKHISDESSASIDNGTANGDIQGSTSTSNGFRTSAHENQNVSPPLQSEDTATSASNFSVQSATALTRTRTLKRKATNNDCDAPKMEYEDEFTLFGKTVSFILRRLSEVDQLAALNLKKQIFDLMYEAEYKYISEKVKDNEDL